jgi:hypothetical protein
MMRWLRSLIDRYITWRETRAFNRYLRSILAANAIGEFVRWGAGRCIGCGSRGLVMRHPAHHKSEVCPNGHDVRQNFVAPIGDLPLITQKDWRVPEKGNLF